jgi:predicted Zn-dependent protease
VIALLTIAVTALCAWSMWQPLRADRESDRALDLAADNKTDAARAAARHAHSIDPLSPRPYVVMNAVEDGADNRAAALKALTDAVRNFPADPQTWIQLAQYQLNALSKPADALQTIAGALYLDPQSRAAQTVFFEATTAVGGVPAATPAPAPAPAPTPPATTPAVPTAPAPPAPTPGSGGTAAPGG